jgi:hypothetical protein
MAGLLLSHTLQLCQRLVGLDSERVAAGDRGMDQLGQRDPRPQQAARQLEDVGQPLVRDDQLLPRIEHAQALRHVLQGSLEARVLRA